MKRLFIQLILLISPSLLVIPFTYSQQTKTIEGFLGIPFGCTQKEAKRIALSKDGAVLNEKHSDSEQLVITGIYWGEMKASVLWLDFVDDKFYSARVHIWYQSSSTDSISLIKTIKRNIELKYGHPKYLGRECVDDTVSSLKDDSLHVITNDIFWNFIRRNNDFGFEWDLENYTISLNIWEGYDVEVKYTHKILFMKYLKKSYNIIISSNNSAKQYGFLGIPFGTSIEEAKNTLQDRGYTENPYSTDDHLILEVNRLFGYDISSVHMYFFRNQFYLANIYFYSPMVDSNEVKEDSLWPQFNEVKSDLINIYGQPNKEKINFTLPFIKGDGKELVAVREKKASFNYWWYFPNNNKQDYTIRLSLTKNHVFFLVYCDLIRESKKEKSSNDY